MKKILKPAAVGLLLLCILLTVAGCKEQVLQESSEWKNNPNLVSRNKELAHIPVMSYSSAEEALASDYSNSQYYMTLNGEWAFSLVNKAEEIPSDFQNTDFAADSWGTITVPGNWATQGYSLPTYTYQNYPWNTVEFASPSIPDDNEIGLYRKTITVPADWDGRETYISFEGVEAACYVYVNGKMVGYGEDSYTSKDFRITSYLQYGKENTVAVKVYKYCDGSWLEAQDGLKMGGIYRDVYLYSSPKTQIKDVGFDIQMQKNFVDSITKVSVNVGAYADIPKGSYVSFDLYDAQNNLFFSDNQVGAKLAYKEDKTGGAHLAETSERMSVSGLHVWTAEDPYLYTAVLTLKNADGSVIDVVSDQIGFRDVGFSTNDQGVKTFTINGVPLKFYGVEYNETSAVGGKYVTADEMTKDILAMKALNINAVRSPGQPFSSTFINLCDKYGLYVVSDVNLSTYPWSRKDAQTIPGDQAIWQTAVLDRLVNVLERDKNNASVVMWSMGSQSGNGSNFTQMKNWLIENESRMIMYDAYLNQTDYKSYETEADIIAATNWNIDKLNDLIKDTENTKPIVIQEFDNGLLSAAGNVESMVKLVEDNANVQGAFLANWADRAIYTPIDQSNAVATVKNTPYSANPELYQLTYAASWDTYTSAEEQVSTSKYSLSGIVSADRKLQSDAEQFKTAYAAIYVSPVDVKAGTFTVKNRNNFTAFENNYEISYEVFAGTQSVKKGTVSNLTLAPGETKAITLDYGTVGSGDYFVTVTVKYKTAPAWAASVSDFDGIVSEVQYDINKNTSPVKGGGETAVGGSDFTVTEFRVPVVETSGPDLANGMIYVTNPSSQSFDSLYTLTYQVIETNNYWANPRPVIYAQGTLSSTGIAANADYAALKLPIDVKAVENGTYFVNVIITTKTTVGDVPAGYKLTTRFTPTSLNTDAIPFYVDAARKPLEVLDDEGNQVYDANGAAMWQEGIGDYQPKGNEVYYEEEEIADAPTEFLTLKNDAVDLEIDTKTGLIKKFIVNGENIFAEQTSTDEDVESPIYGSLVGSNYRNPTGGDYSTDAAATENLTNLKNQSSGNENKTLLNDVSAVKIASGHYRVSLEYVLADYDTSVSRADEYNTKYNIVYDVYANGVINVSVAYALSSNGDIPLSLSNIISLTGDYTKMSWYGRGPGETYPDKLYSSKVSVFNDVSIKDTLGTYLMEDGGDRSEVRWASFTKENGNGILVTSDTTNFAFNVSKVYPWQTTPYSRDTLENPVTVLSIIGLQRGAAAGNMSEQRYKTESTVITPGSYCTYSFRIVPISSSADKAALSTQTLSSAGAASVSTQAIVPNAVYAIQNFSSDKQYVTASGEGLSLSTGLGSDNQVFVAEKEKGTSTNLFALLSLSHNMYVSSMGNSAEKESLEVGLVPSITYGWQKWTFTDSELKPANTAYSLTAAGAQTFSGSRLTLEESKARAEAAWTLNYDVNDATHVTIRNNLTGKYLTVVDTLSFKSPLVQNLDVREFGYPPTASWSKNLQNQVITYDAGDYVSATGHVTQWDLLPSNIQTWQFVDAGNGNFKLFNPNKGTYVGIRDEAVLGSKDVKTTLVEYNPNNVDEQAAAITWRIENRNGLYSIINTDYNLALQSTVQRTKMTAAEMDYEYITDIEKAFKDVYVLSIGTWANLPSQKWDLKSEAEMNINITAGTKWFSNVVEGSK